MNQWLINSGAQLSQSYRIIAAASGAPIIALDFLTVADEAAYKGLRDGVSSGYKAWNITTTEHTFNDAYRLSYIGKGGDPVDFPVTIPEGDAMRKIGKYRFDTKIVRNLMFIHNVHNLLAADIENALTDLSKAVVHGRSVFNPRLHDYSGNDTSEMKETRNNIDMTSWQPISFN